MVLAPAVDSPPCPPPPPGAWTTRPPGGPGQGGAAHRSPALRGAGGQPQAVDAPSPCPTNLKKSQGDTGARAPARPGRAPACFPLRGGGLGCGAPPVPSTRQAGGRGPAPPPKPLPPGDLMPRERRGVGAKAPPPDRERAALPV